MGLLAMIPKLVERVLLHIFSSIQWVCQIVHGSASHDPHVSRESSDDENHRLNICPKWGGAGNDDTDNEVEFNDIYSEDSQTLNHVISKIENVWEVKFANGRMKK